MKKDTKKTISARVNESIVEILSEKDMPTSQIVEAGIVHFLKLSDEDKIAFVAENSAEVTNKEDLKISNKVWSDLLKESVGTTRFKDLTEIAKLAISAGVGFNVARESLRAAGAIAGPIAIAASAIIPLVKILFDKSKEK